MITVQPPFMSKSSPPRSDRARLRHLADEIEQDAPVGRGAPRHAHRLHDRGRRLDDALRADGAPGATR